MSILSLPLMIEIVQISVKDNIHLLLLLSEPFITCICTQKHLKLASKITIIQQSWSLDSKSLTYI